MSLGDIFVIIIFLALIGVLPTSGHTANWGYFPSGGIGVLLVITVRAAASVDPLDGRWMNYPLGGKS